MLPLFISPGLKSAQRPTSSLIPLEVLGQSAFWSFSLQLPSDSKFQSSRCCTRRIVIVLSRRCPSDSAGIATCCRRRAFAKTSKSSFPHNRPPATRLRQCRTVLGLITNVFGQQPVPSRRFRFGLTWRGDFARARILHFFMIAVSDFERYFNHFEQQTRHVSHSNSQLRFLRFLVHA